VTANSSELPILGVGLVMSSKFPGMQVDSINVGPGFGEATEFVLEWQRTLNWMEEVGGEYVPITRWSQYAG
jgi:hypothetical protein